MASRRYTMKRSLVGGMLLSVVVAGCAVAMSPSREAYILAHPHGFVEIAVSDASVPLIENATFDDKGVKTSSTLQKPDVCYLNVLVGSELFLDHGFVWPEGETAPFVVSSGFRFPVPVGRYKKLEVVYAGCDAESVKTSIPLEVHEGMVSSVRFDGQSLKSDGFRENHVTTLEDVVNSLNAIEELLQTGQ
jgi:hypothetical protein